MIWHLKNPDASEFLVLILLLFVFGQNEACKIIDVKLLHFLWEANTWKRLINAYFVTCTIRTSMAGRLAGSLANWSNLLCVSTSSALSTFTSNAYLHSNNHTCTLTNKRERESSRFAKSLIKNTKAHALKSKRHIDKRNTRNLKRRSVCHFINNKIPTFASFIQISRQPNTQCPSKQAEKKGTDLKKVELGLVPSRKAIEMKPKLIIKARKTSLVKIRFLDSVKHLVIHLEFLPLMPRLCLRRTHGSAATALNVFFNTHCKGPQ